MLVFGPSRERQLYPTKREMESFIDSKVTAGMGYVIVSRRLPLIGNEDLREIDGNTLPETNIAPENRPYQKDTSIPTILFR